MISLIEVLDVFLSKIFHLFTNKPIPSTNRNSAHECDCNRQGSLLNKPQSQPVNNHHTDPHGQTHISFMSCNHICKSGEV